MDHPDLPNPPGIAVRWVRSSAGLRAFTAVVGLVIAAIGVALATDRSAQLLCGDRACEVRAAAVLFPTEIRAIDPARPPAVVVRDARHGRNGALAGKSLNLRWTNDEVTLARGDTQSVEAQAVAVRARLAANQGTLVVGSEPSLFFAILGLYCGCLLYTSRCV